MLKPIRNEADEIKAKIEEIMVEWNSAGKQPKLVGVHSVRVGTDSTGDPAVHVTMLLDDNTPDEYWASKHVSPLVERIRKVTESESAQRFTYVNFASPSDLPSEAA